MKQQDWDNLAQIIQIVLRPKDDYRKLFQEKDTKALEKFADLMESYWDGLKSTNNPLVEVCRERCIEVCNIARAELLTRGDDEPT